MKKGYAIVVDGYSSGSLYAHSLKSHGIEAIHVRSYQCSVPFLTATHNPQLYKADIQFNNNYDDLLNEIRMVCGSKNICGVFIGTTSYVGFQLADTLAKSLNVPGNNPATTMQRVDKYLMNATLSNNNIPALRQLLTTNLQQLKDFFNTIKQPVLLKPLLSGGAEGIIICNTEQDLEHAFGTMQNITGNVYGSNNPTEYSNKVLAQEYLSGMEYVVCSFSQNGTHTITSVWKSVKRLICDGSTKARDYLELIDPESNPEYLKLSNYAKQALTCLGLENGPCNSDIILDDTRGPLLLEINPRIPGGMDPLAFLCGTGESFVEQTIKWTVFPETIPSNYQYSRLETVRCTALISYASGYISEFNPNTVSNLPTCIKTAIKPKQIGDVVGKTTDITNLTGMVYLSGNTAQVECDLNQVRTWEKSTFGDHISKRQPTIVHGWNKFKVPNSVKFATVALAVVASGAAIYANKPKI